VPGLIVRGMKKRSIVTILITSASLLAAGYFYWNHPSQQQKRYEENQSRYQAEYLEENIDLSKEIREAIQQGKVILGMNPEEAHAAAGQFVYSITPAPEHGTDYNPLYVIYKQKENPDDSTILMTFWTKAQFNTETEECFTVRFERGRAVSIERKTKELEPDALGNG